MKSAFVLALLAASSTYAAAVFRSATVPELDVISLTKRLARVSSLTGYESSVTAEVKAVFAELGWTVEHQVVAPERENLLARPPGATAGGTPRILFNGHVDTVPPFINITEDALNLYGRGTCDAKGPLAAIIVAANELFQTGIASPDDIAILTVVGEETDHAGAGISGQLFKNGRPEYLIVGEPTELKLATGHKGIVSVVLESEGIASHSGYPEYGKSAISPLLRALVELEDNEWPSTEVLGPTTLNVGLIQGGVASNIVPSSASASIVIRVTTRANEIFEQVRSIVGDRANITVVTISDPVFLNTLPGFETGPMAYGTDIAFLPQGTKGNFLLGPGSILVAHRPDEYVSKDDLLTATELYQRLTSILLSQ